MTITNQEKLKEFKTFIKSISPKDKVGVIYDTDMDGISSGVITVKALEKLGITVYFQRSRTPGTRIITQDLIDIFKSKELTKIIFLDLAVEDYPNVDALDKYDVMVIDHHPTIEKSNKNITTIKSFDLANGIKGHKYCTANVAYDLFSKLIDISELDWVATTGMIGDITYEEHKDWIDKVFEKYNVEKKNNPFDTTIGELVQYATYATCIGTQEEIDKIFNAIYSSKNHLEAIKKLDHLNSVKEEFEKLVSEFDEKKEETDKIIFYEFESKYYLNSPVCTVLSIKQVPDKILICAQKKDEQISISARFQKGSKHIGEMLRECTKGLPNANGGGHSVAAGAKVNKEDYETFKKKVLLWVK